MAPFTPFILERAATTLIAGFDAIAEKKGLSPGEWRIALILHGVPYGLTVNQLANATLVRQPTVSKLLDRMEELGMIIRRRCAVDRRKVYISLSRQGVTLSSSLVADAESFDSGLLDPELLERLSAIASATSPKGAPPRQRARL